MNGAGQPASQWKACSAPQAIASRVVWREAEALPRCCTGCGDALQAPANDAFVWLHMRDFVWTGHKASSMSPMPD